MRLERLPPASAIFLLVAAAVGPVALAASSPVASILSPEAGEIVSATSLVRISYSGYSASAQNVSGYLMLDGEPAGTFTTRVASPNGTTFDARLRALSFASGDHALTARVFTERDDPVDTAPVAIAIDLPPVVRDVSHAYDLDARTLSIGVNVTDDHGDSLVRFATGANNTTHLVNGAFVATLAAPRDEGVHNATITATDGWNHTVQVRFDYAVADREADLTIAEVTYLVGGKLRVSGTAADVDGLRDIRISTQLSGAALANYSPSNHSWWAIVPLAAQLGTFNGTVRSNDSWGGNTTMPFTFTIEGTRETFFLRSITTDAGAYADRGEFLLPRVFDGTIEICIDACGTPAERINRLAEGTLCADADGPPCRALTGRPIISGAFEMCERRSNNQAAYTIGQAIHQNTTQLVGLGPCTSLLGQTGPLPAVEANYTRDPTSVIVKRSNATSATCEAIGVDRTCAFQTAGPTLFEIAWLQAPQKSVTVRISGVRL